MQQAFCHRATRSVSNETNAQQRTRERHTHLAGNAGSDATSIESEFASFDGAGLLGGWGAERGDRSPPALLPGCGGNESGGGGAKDDASSGGATHNNESSM